MLSFQPLAFIGGLIFSTIGFGAWRYGRSLDRWKPTTIGLGLMIYPYFFSRAWLIWGIGLGMMILLWFHHDE